jgi:hypothetical protein
MAKNADPQHRQVLQELAAIWERMSVQMRREP